MNNYRYIPKHVCSREIRFGLEDGKIHELRFIGGCDGNHKGLASLMKGMEIEEVADRLEGITCGFRPTSCPDQLSKVLRQMMDEGK